MKIITIFCIALLLCSMQSYADEDNSTAVTNNSEPYRYLANSSSQINQMLLAHDLTVNSLDSPQNTELPTQISGTFNNEIFSLEAGILQSNEDSTWSKYYFQGALTIHQYNKFNLSLMANIEQLNNFHSTYLTNQVSQTSPTPYIENQTISNQTELNYSYGLVGSYSINATWQFSGGIIHAQAINEPNSNTWYSNKSMALIGTTYSF